MKLLVSNAARLRYIQFGVDGDFKESNVSKSNPDR